MQALKLCLIFNIQLNTNSPFEFQGEKMCLQTTSNKLPGYMQNTPPAEEDKVFIPKQVV